MRTLLFIVILLATGCLTPKAHENPKTADELRVILQDFHMKLRWGLWEQASAYTTPDYRNEFLGRYEELGEDFKITDLEIKSVTLDDPVSTVDVQQESYTEPDMVIQKKRYIESWVHVSGAWLIAERIPKEEWRERQKKTPDTEKKEDGEEPQTPTQTPSNESPSGNPSSEG